MNSPDIITLSSGSSELSVKPSTGGAITGWSVHGHALLRDVPEEARRDGNARQQGCFPLLPYSNRIAHATLPLDGRSYPLRPDPQGEAHSIHGNAWYTPWAVDSRDEHRLVLRLDHDARNERALDWPFAYSARETFDLTPDGLAITLTITNNGNRAMPAGLGLHPYFRAGPGTRIWFQTTGVWLNGEDKLPTAHVPLPAGWSFENGGSPSDAALDNCFSGWNGTARIHWPDAGLRLTMTADDIFRHLVVFTPPGREFFCVEPVSHANGAIVPKDGAGPDILGARLLAPGASLSGTVHFAIEHHP
ncbi:MAG: aldose 1-epimerase [Telmatospirillum sp.]|nr:aldose 1-epimerase [Telmatospirillum sp.]